MNAKQAKHYLLSLPDEVFIGWYNDRIEYTQGYSFAAIEENTPENFWEVVTRNLCPETFLQIAKDSKYSETDKYFYISDKVRSFDSIEELMDEEEKTIVAMFLEDEETERKNLEVERAIYLKR